MECEFFGNPFKATRLKPITTKVNKTVAKDKLMIFENYRREFQI